MNAPDIPANLEKPLIRASASQYMADLFQAVSFWLSRSPKNPVPDELLVGDGMMSYGEVANQFASISHEWAANDDLTPSLENIFAPLRPPSGIVVGANLSHSLDWDTIEAMTMLLADSSQTPGRRIVKLNALLNEEMGKRAAGQSPGAYRPEPGRIELLDADEDMDSSGELQGALNRVSDANEALAKIQNLAEVGAACPSLFDTAFMFGNSLKVVKRMQTMFDTIARLAARS